MTYSTFDGSTQDAVTNASASTIDAVATYGKALADSLLANSEMTQEQHNIVYHNINGWRTAILNNTTPPDWEVPL